MTEGDHLEYLGLDGKILLKLIFKKWNEDVEWIDLVQDKGWRLALINTVGEIRVP
jgi:hypothetical protein